MEAHRIMISRNIETTRGEAIVLDITRNNALSIALNICSYRYHRIQMSHIGDHQQCNDFWKEFLIQFDDDNDKTLRLLWTVRTYLILICDINNIKLCTMGKHESSLYHISTFIWCQIYNVVRHCRHSCSRPVHFWRWNTSLVFNI